VFENKLLRKIFETTKDDINRSGRIFHSRELHTLYITPWDGHLGKLLNIQLVKKSLTCVFVAFSFGVFQAKILN
jgi:hypothetical protein